MKFITVDVKYYSEILEPLAASNGLQTRINYNTSNVTHPSLAIVQDPWRHYPKNSDIKFIIGYEFKTNMNSMISIENFHNVREELTFLQLCIVFEGNKILQKFELNGTQLQKLDKRLQIAVKEPSVSVKYLFEYPKKGNPLQTMVPLMVNKFQITSSKQQFQQILNFCQHFEISCKKSEQQRSMTTQWDLGDIMRNSIMCGTFYSNSEISTQVNENNTNNNNRQFVFGMTDDISTLPMPISTNGKQRLSGVNNPTVNIPNGNGVAPTVSKGKMFVEPIIKSVDSTSNKDHYDNMIKPNSQIQASLFGNLKLNDLEKDIPLAETESNYRTSNNGDEAQNGGKMENASKIPIAETENVPNRLLCKADRLVRHRYSGISSREKLGDTNLICGTEKTPEEDFQEMEALKNVSLGTAENSIKNGLDEFTMKGTSNCPGEAEKTRGKILTEPNDIITENSVTTPGKANGMDQSAKTNNLKPNFRISKRTIRKKLKNPIFNKWVDRIELEILKFLDN